MLKARDDHIQSLLEDAKKQLVVTLADKSKYPTLIEKLIAQVTSADTWTLMN